MCVMCVSILLFNFHNLKVNNTPWQLKKEAAAGEPKLTLWQFSFVSRSLPCGLFPFVSCVAIGDGLVPYNHCVCHLQLSREMRTQTYS